MEAETLDQMQARHRKEQRDLIGRITSKKKNATKKSRKGVNEECADMERRLKEKQEEELAALTGGGTDVNEEVEEDEVADAPANDDTAALADKLKETSVSEATPPTEDDTQTQDQGQGKKRNRQKERMARRAAEIEAAAAKAEEEARGMTDHRGAEKTYMLKEFKTHSLAEKEIAPDGHCLFSAVADQLAQCGIPLAATAAAAAQPPYKVVRAAAAEWMTAHPDDFAPFLEEDLEAYARKIRDTAEWGGQLELAALANVYGVEIRVVQDGRTERIGPSAGDIDGAASEEPGVGGKEIWLAYYRHGYGLGEHYNSLRKTA
ncbi:Putative OTU domain, papain-like cysteine peptidase superfamily [Colletotrichum destructivum]|uniref:OTU domain, papain-like cysteine peptidase superfamily n=1 Tax=Colletotrichum destructivum TaxID=34406 RepID=A0AAX4J0G3_9PEZI|nr:Putative OTU domain, papain-like cysteine peptidase superfamily [Colletotrichum destructivum]